MALLSMPSRRASSTRPTSYQTVGILPATLALDGATMADVFFTGLLHGPR
jgi:hypothetical protein